MAVRTVSQTAAIAAGDEIADLATAEAGVDNSKKMSPLRNAQAAASYIAPTQDIAAAATVPAAVKSIRASGKAATDDGLGGQFVRVASQPAAGSMKNFRSADRFLPNGSVDTVNGGWWIYSPKKWEKITPFQFGATGDRTTDDAAALNDMFAYVRARTVAANQDFNVGLVVDLSGGEYRVAQSINATGITAWSLPILNGMIIGECTGKAILDLCGSRGYALESVGFLGDKTNRPAAAYQVARTTTSGFSDNQSFREVSTAGYFSRAAVHIYAHETAKHDHCTYFNYAHDAPVAIFEGYDAHPMTSDYATVLTGGLSFTNNKLVNCDFRYLPLNENIASITGVTNAANAVITCPGHSFAVGNQVVFTATGGMADLRKKFGTVLSTTATTITVDVDTTALGTFTSGGSVVRRQTASSVYLARAEQFNFDNCYIVGYGQPQLELAFPDPTFPRLEQLDLDILFEGSGNSSNITYTAGSSAVTKSVQGVRVKNYNSNAIDSFLGKTGTDTVSHFKPEISFVDSLFSPKLALTAAQFAFYGADILYTRLTDVEAASYAAFNGRVTGLNDGLTHEIGMRYDTPSETTVTPTVTSSSGTITTVGASSITIRKIGKWVHLDVDVIITTNGTGAGQVNITLTNPAARDTFICGREVNVSGSVLNGEIVGSQLRVRTYNNAYPGADNARLKLSGWYERT